MWMMSSYVTLVQCTTWIARHGDPALQDRKEAGSEVSQAQLPLKRLPASSKLWYLNAETGPSIKTSAWDITSGAHFLFLLSNPLLEIYHILWTNLYMSWRKCLIQVLSQRAPGLGAPKTSGSWTSQSIWETQHGHKFTATLSEAHLDLPPNNLLCK